MFNSIPAASATRDRPENLSRLIFFAPLVGYWLLAMVLAFQPRPSWVVWVCGAALVVMAAIIAGTHMRRRRV